MFLLLFHGNIIDVIRKSPRRSLAYVRGFFFSLNFFSPHFALTDRLINYSQLRCTRVSICSISNCRIHLEIDAAEMTIHRAAPLASLRHGK